MSFSAEIPWKWIEKEIEKCFWGKEHFHLRPNWRNQRGQGMCLAEEILASDLYLQGKEVELY